MLRPKVLECDIDLILLARLPADSNFVGRMVGLVESQTGRQLLFQQATVEPQARHAGASGTIDILVRLWSGGTETARLLVENKLDSTFTPNQPERYAASAAAMSRAGHPALSVLCAPHEYLAKSKHAHVFDACVSYEQVADAVDGDHRTTVQLAIKRFEMPYEPDPVPQVAAFFDGYAEMVGEYAPELVISRNPNSGNSRPRGSQTIYFDVKKTLPRYGFLPTLRFSHQCVDSAAPSPSVKIMFDKWAGHEALLQRETRDDLANTPFHFRKARGSLGLVHDTPYLHNHLPVGVQPQAVLAGIRAAARLRAWMFENEVTLRRWASIVLS